MKKSFFLLLAIHICFSAQLLSQEISSPYQIVPELYPTKTVRVAFHIIHKYSSDDSTNIPDDHMAKKWWNNRIDSINKYLSSPAIPNYEYYKDYSRDTKIQVLNMGVFHHIDSEYWNGADISEFYHEFVTKNRDLSTFMKDSVIHSFYYGDDKWGGMSSGIPSRGGMRFKGRYRDYKVWLNYSPVGHARNDHNYIHELMHSLGTYHNFKNSPQGTECSGCDAELGNFCFDMSTQPYAANNYMAKGRNVKPGGHSITLCQQQRMLYYLWGYDKSILGSTKDVSMLTEPVRKKYKAVVTDTVLLDYDFSSFGDIVLRNNAVFILKSNLKMQEDSKFKIGHDAKLIIDGGTFNEGNLELIEKAKNSNWHFWRKKENRKKGGEIIIIEKTD